MSHRQWWKLCAWRFPTSPKLSSEPCGQMQCTNSNIVKAAIAKTCIGALIAVPDSGALYATIVVKCQFEPASHLMAYCILCGSGLRPMPTQCDVKHLLAKEYSVCTCLKQYIKDRNLNRIITSSFPNSILEAVDK